MQAILETVFDFVYLVTVITLGVLMAVRGKANRQFRLFGIMAIVLGAGDAFHLVPRMYALTAGRLDQFTVALGIGKLITSITMTIFYVLLYHVWRERYHIRGRRGLSAVVYALAAVRAVLCLLPQNEWTNPLPPYNWDLYRNIPFAILGALLIVLFYRSAKKAEDRSFRYLWLTIVLSFGFYLPVVLFARYIPAIGALMIPKTCAYVWTVLIGFLDMQKHLPEKADRVSGL